MNICGIPECGKKHEAKGYCKVHYRSYSRYGDALHVEKERQKREEYKLIIQKINETKRKSMSREGHCSAKNCTNPIISRRLCHKHYQRYLRGKDINAVGRRNTVDSKECLAFGCSNPHKRHGFCGTHLIYIRETETPYKPKIIKLCGVEGCENKHMANGLCSSHYVKWIGIKKRYKLNKYLKLK